MAKREPVIARGLALLALIAASDAPAAGVMMLTQEEGAEAVEAGYAAVDASIVEGKTAAVSLTDAGKAALAAEGSTPAGSAIAAGYEIDTDVEMPTPGARKRAPRTGGYPFDALGIKQSFHVAKPADVKSLDDLLARLSSSVSGARDRYKVEVPGETETVKTRTYKRTEDGKGFVKVDGKRVVENETETTRTKLRATRDFKAMIVGDDDKKGPGVRVFRLADVVADAPAANAEA